MGLDMYLSKRKYVKNWDHMKPEDKHEIVVKKNGVVIDDPMPISELVYSAGYWRKANAIHKWFAENIQEGEDNCGEYYVGHESIKTLLDTVNEVLKASKLIEGMIQNGTTWNNETKKSEPIMEKGKLIEDPSVAKLLLPTEGGFFFGSTEYDQYYYDDLVETKNILEKCLDEDFDYYYRSSW